MTIYWFVLARSLSAIRPMADVRFGSLGDMAARLRHVRFTPKSGIYSDCSNVRFVPQADIGSRRLQLAVGVPLDGVIEAVVAPKQLTACNKGWG